MLFCVLPVDALTNVPLKEIPKVKAELKGTELTSVWLLHKSNNLFDCTGDMAIYLFTHFTSHSGSAAVW